ncbi:MAG: Zn-dependent membrane protease YugP, partial [Maribacter sp.]
MGTDYIIFMLLTGGMSMIGMLIGQRLQAKAKKYGAIPMKSGYTGAEVAKMMLRHYNVADVNITQGKGFLTDHYNPRAKVVSLSPEVYSGRSIMSAAVAAHEVGHAIQHDRDYPFLQMRSALVPIVQFSSNIQQYVLMAALGGVFGLGQSPIILLFAIGLFGLTALFSFMTLPVEFDATRRGLAWLEESGISE